MLDEAQYWTWSRELAFGYQMTRPFTAETPEPILCVSLKRCPSRVTKPFGTFESLGIERVKLVEKQTRALHFCRLADYKAPPAPDSDGPAPDLSRKRFTRWCLPVPVRSR